MGMVMKMRMEVRERKGARGRRTDWEREVAKEMARVEESLLQWIGAKAAWVKRENRTEEKENKNNDNGVRE